MINPPLTNYPLPITHLFEYILRRPGRGLNRTRRGRSECLAYFRTSSAISKRRVNVKPRFFASLINELRKPLQRLPSNSVCTVMILRPSLKKTDIMVHKYFFIGAYYPDNFVKCRKCCRDLQYGEFVSGHLRVERACPSCITRCIPVLFR